MTKRILKLIVLALLVVSVILGVAIVAAQQDDSENQALIDNAMSAAPPSISQDATIIDWTMDEDGNYVVLREGTNGWTCFSDNLNTPMNNPTCYDQVWMTWLAALRAGEDPSLTVTVPGFSYMLQGDDAASNTDPTATEPAAGEHRMAAGPHIMILLPASVDISGIGTDDHSGNSWVMWADTPVQHIMVPVADVVDMPGMDS